MCVYVLKCATPIGWVTAHALHAEDEILCIVVSFRVAMKCDRSIECLARRSRICQYWRFHSHVLFPTSLQVRRVHRCIISDGDDRAQCSGWHGKANETNASARCQLDCSAPMYFFFFSTNTLTTRYSVREIYEECSWQMEFVWTVVRDGPARRKWRKQQ